MFIPLYRKLLPAALFLFGLFLIDGCTRQTGDLKVYRGETMGSYFSVQWYGETGDDREIERNISQLLESVNQSMSTYIKDSELSRFNRLPADGEMQISSDLMQVMKSALKIASMTGGAFDFTVGPLVNLWGFGPEKKRESPPDEQSIRVAMKNIGYQNVQLDEASMRLSKQGEIYIDLSAIAKGYAVDQVAEYLESRGIDDYLVEVGGELRAAGVKADGAPWRVGIERPVISGRQVERVIEAREIGIATSGDYRNYFEKDGVRYSHTIDPVSGRPVTHMLASVTVIQAQCATADALATALMVMGPEKGFSFAEENRIPAFFIIKQGKGFEARWTQSFDVYLAR